MNNYIPEIGALFTVGSDTKVYQRCSSEDIKSHFDVFIPENYIYFMYEGICGKLYWNYFGKFNEFKPVVPLTHKENNMFITKAYLPEVGEAFYVNNDPCLFTRCSLETFYAVSGIDKNDKHNDQLFCLYTRLDGSITWNVWTRFDCFISVEDEQARLRLSNVKPPIGILPLRTHNYQRLNALMDTLQRYAEAGSPAKEQWIQEVKSLIEYERSLTREALDKVPFKL